MKNYVKRRFIRVLGIAAVLAGVMAAASFLLGIWFIDGRWIGTGFVMVVAAAVLGVSAGAMNDTIDDEGDC